jgi:hypothetical protein
LNGNNHQTSLDIFQPLTAARERKFSGCNIPVGSLFGRGFGCSTEGMRLAAMISALEHDIPPPSYATVYPPHNPLCGRFLCLVQPHAE